MNNQFDELTKRLAQSVTRSAALKKFGIGFAGIVLALILTLAPSANAGAPNNPDPQRIVFTRSLGGYVVTGAANSAHDPRNLQWALDRSDGGTVFLRQTFDLGTRTVFITTNVRLTSAPGASPVIKNGGDPNAAHDSPYQSAIYVGWNGQALLSPPAHGLYGVQEHPRYPGTVQYFPAFPVRFSIQGLHFEDCVRGAIMVGACNGANIDGNTFTNMKSGIWDPWILTGPVSLSCAILASGAFVPPYLGLTSTSSLDPASLASASRSIGGSVRIRDNCIERVGAEDPAAERSGIAVTFASAELVIEDNLVSDVDTGIRLISTLGPRSLIQGNRVSNADFYGILCWAYLFKCTFTVVGNEVEVGGPGSEADGIALAGETYDPQNDFAYVESDATVVRSEVSHNTITHNGSEYGGITLYNHCVRTRVTDNTIRGNAAWAIGSLINEESETAEHNTIANNSMGTAFEAGLANILLMPSVNRCMITRNTIGGGGIAGVVCQGNRNSILANDYSASGYPGFAEGPGCVLLDTDTTGNIVAETKFPAGTDVCEQVQNLGLNFVLAAGDCD